MMLAEWEAVPRMMDAKIAGQRRFYVQRGQVTRACSLGVQNFDHPRVLVLAYATMAQRHGLHFFAARDGVVCTGKAATPPPTWFEAVGSDAVSLSQESAGLHGCGHADRARVLLGLADGPTVACCAPCAGRLEGLHRRMRERHVGPHQKRPFTIQVRKADGQVKEPSREALARYRAGIASEADIIRSAA